MSNAPYQNFDVREIGDVTVVGFREKRILDESTIQGIAEELFYLVKKVRPKKMLLNFERIEYMSSAALGKLINLHKLITTQGGRLSLCNVIPQVSEVFAITRLDKIIGTEPYPDANDCDDDEADGDLGGVPARFKPPKPTGSGTVSLQPPTSDAVD